MKIIIVSLFIILGNSFFAQKQEEKVYQWFKYILKQDKSNLDKAYIRIVIFKQNFDILNTQLKEHALHCDSTKNYTKKTNDKIDFGINITFTHILQTYPELILNEEYIQFIKNQIDTKNLDKKLLVDPLKYYYYNMNYYTKFQKGNIKNGYADDIQHQLDPLYYKALDAWGINLSEIENFNNLYLH